MELINEIITCINNQRSNLDCLVKDLVGPGKINEFYTGLINGDIVNDEDAAELLYGNKSEANSVKYKKLKSRLREVLYDSFRVFPFIDSSAKQSQVTQIAKAYFILKLMIKYSLDKNLFAFGDRLLKKCIKEQDHYHGYKVGELLFVMAGNRGRKKKVLNYYSEIYLSHLKLMQAEAIATNRYTIAINNYASSNSLNKIHLQEIIEYYDEVMKLTKNINRNTFLHLPISCLL